MEKQNVEMFLTSLALTLNISILISAIIWELLGRIEKDIKAI